MKFPNLKITIAKPAQGGAGAHFVTSEAQENYWLLDSRSRLRSLLSSSLKVRGQASDSHWFVTAFSRLWPSPSIADTP